ncbi:MAG: GGDEF domain-containing protein [Candidatus Omnitrophica bacterium]|nr:GGDEF domain-containing protein [Candidatus Omnitrophota bacterium]
MNDFQFVKKQRNILLMGYGFFCSAAVIGIFLIDNFMKQEISITGALSSFWTTIGVHWGILFLMGLPFIFLFINHEIDQEKLIRTDEATGLYSRRQLLKTLDRELERAQRYKRELSILMIDLDDFKKINDLYGHLAGDRILKEISVILSESLRSGDTVGRYGGDEFLAILPETGAEAAQKVAFRIWGNVGECPFKIKNEIVYLSISVGISSLNEMSGEADRFRMIHQADKAMFYEKSA